MEEALVSVQDAADQVLQALQDGNPTKFHARAGALAMINLKRYSRDLFEDVETKRQRTIDAKQQMEKTNLQLENLLYEKNHYEKEIHSCRSFTSACRDDQVWSASKSPEDFLARAPPEYQCDPSDPHKLMVNRLEFELSARRELEKKRRELSADKEALQKTITDRHKFLSWLSAELKKMRDSTKVLREKLGLPNPDDEQAQLAVALPGPLRTLHAVLQECKEHPSNPHCDVSITGTPAAIDEILAEQRKGKATAAGSEGARAKGAGNGADEEAEDEQNRRATRGARLQRTKGQAFPLVVTLHILHEHSDEVLVSVAFRMLTTQVPPTVVVRCDDDAGERVLRAAFPPEAKASDEAADGADADGSADQPGSSEGTTALLGKPYRWAQVLAGLEAAKEGSAEGSALQVALQSIAAIRSKKDAQQDGQQVA